jgi:hypothetical protein
MRCASARRRSHALHPRGRFLPYGCYSQCPPAYVEARTRELIRPHPDAALGRLSATKQVVHIVDIATIASYLERNPFTVTPVELGGYRASLAVPVLKEDELIGAITINRQEVCPLLKSCVSQAVTAIENAHLLNEVRESLQQQTATAHVLKIISRSPGDLQPVSKPCWRTPTRICEAKFGVMWLSEGGGFQSVAVHGPTAHVEWRQLPANLEDRYHQPVWGSRPSRLTFSAILSTDRCQRGLRSKKSVCLSLRGWAGNCVLLPRTVPTWASGNLLSFFANWMPSGPLAHYHRQITFQGVYLNQMWGTDG